MTGDGIRGITSHRPQLPAENDLSRRYLRMLEAWLPVGVELFAPWPQRERCGHFLSGAHWYGLETSGPLFALAVACSAPELDTSAAGVSKNELADMAVAAIRYLCFTHDTGPEDCVRPDHGLGDPRNFSAKWGERGKGFFKESQCGRTTAPLTAACLLLGERCDDETRAMVAAVNADYLQRFGDMPPRSGVYLDTQMEENGWTAEGLTAAHLFLENHTDAAAWEQMTRRWMFSTCAAPQDAANRGPMGATTVSAYTAKTITTLPDYWAENHRMVHPSYTAAGIKFTMYCGNMLRLWGRDLPPELLWNRDRVYANLKFATDGGGYVQPVQGMDWPYLPTVGNDSIHAIASVLFNDADAAALQRRALRVAELRQQANNGRLVNAEVAEQAREKDRATVLREAGIAEVANLYLWHRFLGTGPEPTPEAELSQRLQGVRRYTHAGVALHRHERGQTSLSWRNVIMALPLPSAGIFTIAPARNSWLAQPEVENAPDSHDLLSLHLDEHPRAFAAAFVMDRCQGTLRQQVLFACLPDGRVLSWEQVDANRPCHLLSLQQGFLRITNEKFPTLDNGCRGQRVLFSANGALVHRGGISQSPDADSTHDLGAPAWVNIDDQLGVQVRTQGGATLTNRHYYEAYQVIADDLVLSARPLSTLQAGATAGVLAALLSPDQTHEETAAAGFSVHTSDDGGIALTAHGYVAVANFGNSESVRFHHNADTAVAVYQGTSCRLEAGTVQHDIALAPGSTALRATTGVVRVQGTARLEGTHEGVYVTAMADDVTVGASGQSLGRGQVTFLAGADLGAPGEHGNP